MQKIIACIDGSAMAQSVCDAAIWASRKLEKTVLFLHTIEKEQQHGADDLSGAIGLGASAALLEEMAALDQKRAELALQLGKNMLSAAAERAGEYGVSAVEQKQRHGDLLESLTDLEEEARIVVLGRSGEGHQGSFSALGSHVEQLIRQLHTPLLIVPKHFSTPKNFMLAYDGRDTADKAVQRIIRSDLLKGLPCHLVTVRNKVDDQMGRFERTKALLESEGFEVTARYLEGDIYDSLLGYKQQHDIDLMLIGAFAHSKIRQFFLGSNTLRMIESATKPMIVLR
ncbi:MULTISPECIES: universal stress protein [Spongiibacter]|uniref:universal stress protein n=1 Tax=Spongiibacter TaxID=630749 RepID=UPI000C68584E|nr:MULTISPECIES: universal stress protein [Spongiibacter]MAY39790.1 universal stress protein [Spongiibacter sp.]MBI58908.1 universal stress protein [Spongiibacter sp.]MBU71574.1 universal stress protein [Spongiibacter sp.]|tara:strand:- start:330 stop:1181 length:852 start_codon:yes stop_codon:yes gene_type:complete